MSKMTPAAREEFEAIAAEIAKAHEFTAHYRNGPHDKITERGFTNYAEAAEARDRIVAERSKFGRGGLVYAVNKLGSFPCTPELIERASQIAGRAL